MNKKQLRNLKKSLPEMKETITNIEIMLMERSLDESNNIVVKESLVPQYVNHWRRIKNLAKNGYDYKNYVEKYKLSLENTI
jgi:hypothetical protein